MHTENIGTTATEVNPRIAMDMDAINNGDINGRPKLNNCAFKKSLNGEQIVKTLKIKEILKYVDQPISAIIKPTS